MSTPQAIDSERVEIMADVYESTAGYQQIMRRAKFFAELMEQCAMAYWGAAMTCNHPFWDPPTKPRLAE